MPRLGLTKKNSVERLGKEIRIGHHVDDRARFASITPGAEKEAKRCVWAHPWTAALRGRVLGNAFNRPQRHLTFQI